MEKRQDIQIYILSHKPIDYQREDSLYTPLQVGNYADFCDVRDNTGENVSDWNPILAEYTGTYWIAHNAKGYKYLGECQYRRRLEFSEDYDFDSVFSDYQAICAEPLHTNISVYEQYSVCHNRTDMEECERIIKTLYPEMSEGFDHFIKGSDLLFYSNSFILPAEEFRAYADFAYVVISEYLKSLGCETPEQAQAIFNRQIIRGERRGARGEKYQNQVGGFLSERLWTLWCRTKYDRIYTVPYKKFEGV